jgi:hypothetical protein
MGSVEAAPVSFYGKFDYSLSVTLPPLGVVIFKRQAVQEPPPPAPQIE